MNIASLNLNRQRAERKHLCTWYESRYFAEEVAFIIESREKGENANSYRAGLKHPKTAA